MLNGHQNTGPAREIWNRGDRVALVTDRRTRGTVSAPRRDPHAFETESVWVEWDDGEFGYIDPSRLDR